MTPVRNYWIRFSCPVEMFDVYWRDLVVDVNFVGNLSAIGHFDAECVTWDHPAATFSDPYGVSRRLPITSLTLFTNPDSETRCCC